MGTYIRDILLFCFSSFGSNVCLCHTQYRMQYLLDGRVAVVVRLQKKTYKPLPISDGGQIGEVFFFPKILNIAFHTDTHLYRHDSQPQSTHGTRERTLTAICQLNTRPGAASCRSQVFAALAPFSFLLFALPPTALNGFA